MLGERVIGSEICVNKDSNTDKVLGGRSNYGIWNNGALSWDMGGKDNGIRRFSGPVMRRKTPVKVHVQKTKILHHSTLPMRTLNEVNRTFGIR